MIPLRIGTLITDDGVCVARFLGRMPVGVGVSWGGELYWEHINSKVVDHGTTTRNWRELDLREADVLGLA